MRQWIGSAVIEYQLGSTDGPGFIRLSRIQGPMMDDWVLNGRCRIVIEENSQQPIQANPTEGTTEHRTPETPAVPLKMSENCNHDWRVFGPNPALVTAAKVCMACGKLENADSEHPQG